MSDIFDKMKAEAFGGASSSWDYADIPDRVRRSQMDQLNLERNLKYGDQEALLKMQEIQQRIEQSKALTEQYLATAKNQSSEDKYADKLAKAEAAKKQAQLAQSIPLLARLRSQFGDGSNSEAGRLVFETLQKEFPNLPPEIAGYFGKPEAMSVTDKLLEDAQKHATMLHPELGKTLRNENIIAGQNQRNQDNIASKERIAAITSTIRKEIEEAKIAGKPMTESQVLGSLLQKVMKGDITKEELNALDVAQVLRSATAAVPGVAATVTPSGDVNIANKQQKPSDVAGKKSLPPGVKALP